MRVLITGASGYLGRHLLAVMPPAWEMWACFHQHTPPAQLNVQPQPLDITDEGEVRALFDRVKPDVVIHTAIARNPERFDAVMVRGSAHVAAAAAAIDARLLYLSTDILFDGMAETYDETAQPAPEPGSGEADVLSAHGRAKARAEQAVRAQHPSPAIVRTSLIYGFEPLDHATRWLAAGLGAGQPVTLFTDQIRCPIFAPDLAACLIELAILPFTGVINVAGPVAISRYDFGLLLCRALGFDPQPILAIPTPADVVAPRRLVLTDALADSLLATRRRSPQQVCVRP